MSAIHTGDLRAEGLNGLGTILEFRLEEMPGTHSTAMMACRVDTGKAAGLPGEPVCDRTITIYRAGADRLVYSGMIRRGSVTEENGVQTMRLELVSGTIRMDLAKKDRSWQDTGMSYGALFRQVAARAGAGVLYPSYLDSRPLGTPRVQYQETDWEFLKRMAGHFGLPLYPERPEAG
ncbi:MAG: phage late control D family protein, partial [Lachnospiraceae bacterium]|nr:phage late control D family protein [Lachnospiraceae bacterium]